MTSSEFGTYIEIDKALSIVCKHVSYSNPNQGDKFCQLINSKYVLPLLNSCSNDNDEEYIFTFPYAKGGDLFNYFKQLGRPLNEAELKIVLKRVLKGVEALHSISICHRDINPKNIFLTEQGNLGSCIVGGLEHACIIPESGYIKGCSGTKIFIAPETQSQVYNEKVDIWSIGELAFYLLTRKHHTDYEEEIKTLEISDDLNDLLIILLFNDPISRPSASTALRHPWFGNNSTLPDNFDEIPPL